MRVRVLLLCLCAAASSAAAQDPAPPANEDCLACHEDTSLTRANGTPVGVRPDALTGSVHEGLTCVDCHQDLAAQTEWPHPENLAPAACGSCHEDVAAMAADSIHERARVRSGLSVAPSCGTCHGAHDIKPVSDPASRVHRANVPATCGTCHEGINERFKVSVHAQRLAAGSPDAPACADCHSAHRITRAENPTWRLQVVEECGTCHTDKLQTYRDTFHGQVTALGFERVAKCADCHGAHDILPKDHPSSRIADANLVKTCSQCHEGASANFVKYDPHADPHDRERNPTLYFASQFMTVLLVGVFAFFGMHSGLWFLRSIRERKERR
jgi:nitrate/TMAO reductase-like tetraheme cytochrome c subunit